MVTRSQTQLNTTTWKASFMVLNSLNFCLSRKLLISPSNLNESLSGQSILGCKFFSFITLNTSCHSLLAYSIPVEKSADNLMRDPLYVICHFSLVVYNILSVSLIFVSLITVYLGVFLLGFILSGTLRASWGKFSAIMYSSIFLGPFSLSAPSGTPIMRMLSQRTTF